MSAEPGRPPIASAARRATSFASAWVPTFGFPTWLQHVTVIVPTRWAMDGFDAMTWRGLGFEAAAGPIAVLLGFAALFTTIAVWRFRWDEA